MQDVKKFCCPFEAKGRQEGSIIEIELSESKAERLGEIRHAYTVLHALPTKTAIQMTMPASVQAACTSAAALKLAMLPYQSEVLAVDIDMRLDPYLCYQAMGKYRQGVRVFSNRDLVKDITARMFEKDMRKLNPRTPENVVELSEWIWQMFEKLKLEPKQSDGIIVTHEALTDYWTNLLSLSPGSVVFHEHVDDEDRDLNTFNIVKGPCYPKPIGRYNETVQLIVNRQQDVAALSEEMQLHIRRQANTVHRACGIRIESLDETHQPFGVWVPHFGE